MYLQEATYGETAQAMDKVDKGDENLRVSFASFPHYNEAKSNAEGRPIFDMKTYVTIIVPGQQDVVHRVAWSKDFHRFPRQYQAFLNNQNQDQASGTPLRVLTFLQANQIKELEYFNCVTVEQLASLADNITGRFMGLQGLKQRAKDFLEEAAKQAPLVKMRAELEDRDAKISTMQEQMKQLQAQIQSLSEHKAKK